MRTSSTVPSKKPAGRLGVAFAVDAERMAVPIAAGAMLSDLGVRAAAVMAAGDASRFPFRYRRHNPAVASYVTAA
jgi:hypothetical protein